MAIWAVTVALFSVASVSAIDDGPVLFVAYVLFVLAFATVGALVASRRPRNPIGWILILAGLCYALGGLTASTVGDSTLLGVDRRVGLGGRGRTGGRRSACCCSRPGTSRRRAGGRSRGCPR